jgi:hypothetical protein
MYEDLAAGGPLITEKELEQCALPCTAGAGNKNELPFRNENVRILQRWDILLIPFADMKELYHL